MKSESKSVGECENFSTQRYLQYRDVRNNDNLIHITSQDAEAFSDTAAPHLVPEYGRLFVSRRAYTLHSTRPHPETGRRHQIPAQRLRAALEVIEDTLRQRLEGEITLGLYAINGESQCCKRVAIEADGRNLMAGSSRRGKQENDCSLAGAILWPLASVLLASAGQDRQFGCS